MTTTIEETATAWYWLDDTERRTLLDFSPDAKRVINETVPPGEMTEKQFFPFTPVGSIAQKQGTNKPWLPVKHVVVSNNDRQTVEIYHPIDSSFTKWEQRRGILATVRRKYTLNFDKLILAVMSPALRALKWNIYQTSGSGDQHIYLCCDLPGVNKKAVLLYVPTSYFRTKNFSAVETFHERVAVGYYRGSGFNVSADQLKEWQQLTAAVITAKETLAMRSVVEAQKL